MILVIAEQRDGTLNRVSWEAVAAAQQLAAGAQITVAVLGGATGGAPQELAAAAVAEVLVAEHPALEPYTPDAFATGIRGLVESTGASVVLLPHTYQTRDFAPLVAARMRAPLVSDVTAIAGAGKDATFTRPMFQGRLAAEVKPRGAPVFVTCQVGAFSADAAEKGTGAPIARVGLTIDAGASRQKPEPPFQKGRHAVDLSQAERIVAVGRGIKSQEHLPMAETLAAALGAELAASRPICDSGWLPMERQIGSSGQTVAPKLYVALGISGAIQHQVGMKGAQTIVAINKDPDAPIFEVADYGLVADLFEIVPALTEELRKK